ncbi:MAG: DUF362 domain-containing protein [Myxococcales bacterium]
MAAAATGIASGVRAADAARAKVFVIKESDRARAVEACFEALGFSCEGRATALKANFNSADPFPASTHPDTLKALFVGLKKRKPGAITFAERSGMGDTREVLKTTGAAAIAEKAGAKVRVLDEAPKEEWKRFEAEHWPQGFYAARTFTDAGCVVHTMCCKTHRFGGNVTLALKNTIGLVAKRVPGIDHDFMRDLHGSPHQRAMIAEANVAWRPQLNVMDCLEAFTSGGPEAGTRVAPGVFLVSEDRCALDAAAIALLRLHGMKGPASEGPIGRTDQLARAIALGIGAAPEHVEVLATHARAGDVAAKLAEQLAPG